MTSPNEKTMLIMEMVLGVIVGYTSMQLFKTGHPVNAGILLGAFCVFDFAFKRLYEPKDTI